MIEKILLITLAFSAAMFVVGCLVSMIAMIWSFRLSTRLEKVDPMLWEKYHKYECFGMQIYPANGYKMIPFFFNQEACHDGLIKHYKKICKNAVLIVFVTIGSSVLLLIGIGVMLLVK